MKKIFISILALLLLVNFTETQAHAHFSLGARAGLSISNLSFDPDLASGVTKSSRTGFKFGALAEIGFIPMLALQVEPMYATGGCEISGTGGKITFKLSNLEIPILVKFKIPVPGSISPYIFAGPNLIFVMSSKELDEITGYPSKETDQKDYTSSVLFALDFGAGAGFKVLPLTTIIFDVRYSFGLSNLLNDKGKESWGSNQTVKPTGFQIVAGVMFGL